jgi:RimJ/RimL family protein N-acetyltransferase
VTSEHPLVRRSVELKPFEAFLRDGRRVRLRPVTVADAPKLIEAMGRMSERSRYYRFGAHVDQLSDEQVRYLTDLDYDRHVAWAAEWLDEPGEPGAGLARFVRLPDSTSAEFKVAVVDEFQRAGLGKLLMETLLLAAGRRGLHELVGYIHPDNFGALRLCERLGTDRPRAMDGMMVVRIPVSSGVKTRRASGWFQAPRL